MKSKEVDFINKELKAYGLNPRGEPLFRVVWSEGQTEVRRGEFNEFSPSGLIFLRTVIKTQECKKYAAIRNKWLLEKWIAPDPCYTDEIVSARGIGSYECIYIFQDKERNYLPPNWVVTQLVLQSLGRKTTDTSENAEFRERKKDEEETYQGLMKGKEEAMKKELKFPDGTNANKYTDGFFIPGAGEKENAKT